ncbi:hypothetical protein D3C81_1884230 [compost metagenome]
MALVCSAKRPLPNPPPACGKGREQSSLHPGNLPLPRQKHQHIARMLGQGLLHRATGLRFQRFIATGREVAHVHRITAAFTGQARRIEEVRQPLAVERGRHHHDAQVIAQL